MFFPNNWAQASCTPDHYLQTATHIPLIFPERAIAKSRLSMAFSHGGDLFSASAGELHPIIPTTENCCESCCESILPVCDLALPSHSSHSDPRGSWWMMCVFSWRKGWKNAWKYRLDILVDITIWWINDSWLDWWMINQDSLGIITNHEGIPVLNQPVLGTRYMGFMGYGRPSHGSLYNGYRTSSEWIDHGTYLAMYICMSTCPGGWRRDLSIDTYAYIHCITLHYITLNIHMYMYDLFMYMAAMAIGKQKETFPSKEAHGICQDASDTSEFQSQIELMLIS